MNVRAAHSDSSWRFEWSTPAGHEWALRWVEAKGEWQRLFRAADPVDGHCEGWGPHQEVHGLPRPNTEDEARSVAERYVERKP